MNDLKISQQQLDELVKFINQVPTQWGHPLITFFSKLIEEQNFVHEASVPDVSATPVEELKAD